MRVVKKNVYYCDYCNKKGLRSLKIHEKHCTANPDRMCRLCENPSVKEIIEKYKRYFEIIISPSKISEFGEEVEVKYFQDFTLNDIRLEIDYQCPNCLLTIIRCVGLNRFYFEKKFEFNYKQELEDWWKMSNTNKWGELEEY